MADWFFTMFLQVVDRKAFTKTEDHEVRAVAAVLLDIVGHSHVVHKPGIAHVLAGLGRKETVRAPTPSRREGGA